VNIAELRAWLRTHQDDLFKFVEIEAFFDDRPALYETLGFWTGNPDWDDGRYEFDHLCADGCGSIFAAWHRPEVPPAVVFFGSEGGRGVLTSSLLGFAQALAHGVDVVEYADFDLALSALSPENPALSPEDPEYEDAVVAHGRYRKSVEGTYGALPKLGDLLTDVDDQNAEFGKWVASRIR